MIEKQFQNVAYIGLRKSDGNYRFNIPLYVSMADICSDSITEILRLISESVNRYHEQQISNFFQTKKGVNNENQI